MPYTTCSENELPVSDTNAVLPPSFPKKTSNNSRTSAGAVVGRESRRDIMCRTIKWRSFCTEKVGHDLFKVKLFIATSKPTSNLNSKKMHFDVYLPNYMYSHQVIYSTHMYCMCFLSWTRGGTLIRSKPRCSKVLLRTGYRMPECGCCQSGSNLGMSCLGMSLVLHSLWPNFTAETVAVKSIPGLTSVDERGWVPLQWWCWPRRTTGL